MPLKICLDHQKTQQWLKFETVRNYKLLHLLGGLALSNTAGNLQTVCAQRDIWEHGQSTIDQEVKTGKA